ncbi:hypothetical protein UFOVP183_47 [uncultured Caudovirales phage]|uniref:Uncharacterized protein n=1 Tax=uncultured Caudovirales phage TaxID=2100421 RepID=A0A6J7WCT2_9CAUD|nr:hypothetical protein UFOVP183_47 [uncultured Caudovirales phage]
MNTSILKRARELWLLNDVPRNIARHNIRAWVKSVRTLGDKSLLATKVERKS